MSYSNEATCSTWDRQCPSSFIASYSCLSSFSLNRIRNGVVLSPVFILFIDDLLIWACCFLWFWCFSWWSLYCAALMYTDDLFLMAASPLDIQALFDTASYAAVGVLRLIQLSPVRWLLVSPLLLHLLCSVIVAMFPGYLRVWWNKAFGYFTLC